MDTCEFNSRIAAYHDGELDAATTSRVAEHVKGCAACADVLDQLRQVSGLFSQARELAAAEVSAAELKPIHDAVELEIARVRPTVDRNFWRTAGTLGALAASVLIVASAWLFETPAPHGPAAIQVSAAPPWERVATTLQVDPLPQVNNDPLVDRSALADAHENVADWMLASLKGSQP